MSIKIKVEREVSIASAFTHLIAAWDTNPHPWYRKVYYTRAGLDAIQADKEPRKDTVLAVVTMWTEDGETTGRTKEAKITGQWIARTLVWCLNTSAEGLHTALAVKSAMEIIDERPSADQNTADLVMQVGAYGKVVFG